MTNIEAKLELLVCSRNDMPAMPTRMGDAGRLLSDSCNLRQYFLGALERGGVGQLDVDDEPALILLRKEARRRTVNSQYVRTTSPP